MALPILRKSQIQPAGSSGSTSSGSTTSGGTVSATPAGGVKHAPYYPGGLFNRSVKLIVTTAGTPQAAIATRRWKSTSANSPVAAAG